jgi:predicted Zn-dependent protease
MNAFASLDSNDPEFRHKALNLKSVITLENLNYFLTLYNHNFMTNKYYNKQRKNGEALYLVQINTLEQDSEDNEIILGIIYREVLETALNFTLNDKKLDGKELIDKCCTDPIIKSLMLKALKLN